MIDTSAGRRGPGAPWARRGSLSCLAGVVLLAACGDKNVITSVVPPTNIVTTAVATFKDSTFDFTTLHTFAMPDTVVQFPPATGTPLAVTRQFDQVALNQVRADLIARGYVEVTDPQTTMPDFVVLTGVTATTNYNAFVGYPFFVTWGFYPGWGFFTPGFNNSWTIAFPWFPVVGATAYDRGTLVVTIIPTKTINPLNESITAAWAGVASALLNGNITSSTVTSAIDAMFAQSPYLTASPVVTPH